jgi:hypothetical protein
MGSGLGTDGSKKWRIVYWLPFEALINEAVMSTADATKKFGFSRASGFEDFPDRLQWSSWRSAARGSWGLAQQRAISGALRSAVGEEEVLLGSWSFVHRSYHLALLEFPSLLRVEITHALGCGFLLYWLGTSWGFSRRPHVRLR